MPVLTLGLVEQGTGFGPHPGFSAVAIHGLHGYGRRRSSSRAVAVHGIRSDPRKFGSYVVALPDAAGFRDPSNEDVFEYGGCAVLWGADCVAGRGRRPAIEAQRPRLFR